MNLQLKALKAIYDKKPHLVAKYISAGLTGNLLNFRDGVLLRAAITSNQPEIAKAILDAGANGFVLKGEAYAAAFKLNNRKRPGNYTYLLKFHGNRLSISGAGWHSSLRQAMM